METQMMDEQQVREQVLEAMGTIRPLLTMSREGLMITALEWGVAREPAYETATAAAAAAPNNDMTAEATGTEATMGAATGTAGTTGAVTGTAATAVSTSRSAGRSTWFALTYTPPRSMSRPCTPIRPWSCSRLP